ncbi:DUF3310 domain-containing protein [Streptococcus uberis]|uniref:DUF3310 domain-containing protein n=1 Tax=Streptococcus uberis TaxID=1349 RepID=UPI001FF49846|nr:DUF3310 domain-containing protein [Streptococcus uberis]MCK1222626.1 DUF3310 domain-containing protein [Streptococcus uberis]
MDDLVNKPNHYQGRFGIESIDVMRNFMTDEQLSGFFLGNAIKYQLRYQKKNGLEDLKKARKNLDWLIESMHDSSELGLLKNDRWGKYVERFGDGGTIILVEDPELAFRLTRSEARKYPEHTWVSLKEVNA